MGMVDKDMLDEKILSVLRNSRDSHISGEELTKLADVSRAAIWKHIEKLRDDGYEIDATPHLGYRLVNIPDAMIPAEIKWKLKTRLLGKKIVSYKKADSTNDIAYELAEKGIEEGAVILAEEQLRGKGRRGRRWSSPPKGGLYMSCVLRPQITPREITRITLLAAVAAARAIREMSGLAGMIKWPNDVLVNGRKVCGILTEMKAQQDSVDFVIVGIGVNVNTEMRYLPKGASSLKEEMDRTGRNETLSRLELAKKVLETLEEDYFVLKKEGFGPIIDQWKHLSAILGSRIKVVLPTRTFEAQAYDIDEDGALLVRVASGILERVSSGDIVMVR